MSWPELAQLIGAICATMVIARLTLVAVVSQPFKLPRRVCVHAADSLPGFRYADRPQGTDGYRRVCFLVRSSAPGACCPLCKQPSESIHSRYVRRLADLPCHGKAVAVRLQVRRFRCLAPQCVRRIFAERFLFVATFARATRRLHDTHAQIGLFLGGEGGSRLAGAWP